MEIFLNFASYNAKNSKYIHCPCHRCRNINFGNIKEVRDHLYFNGVDQSYTNWIFSGETLYNESPMCINEKELKTFMMCSMNLLKL